MYHKIWVDHNSRSNDDSAAGLLNTTIVTGNVLANDDQGNAPATIFAFDNTGTSGGSLVSNGDGTFDYTPLTDFTGTDSFTYTPQDSDGDQSTATPESRIFVTRLNCCG